MACPRRRPWQSASRLAPKMCTAKGRVVQRSLSPPTVAVRGLGTLPQRRRRARPHVASCTAPSRDNSGFSSLPSSCHGASGFRCLRQSVHAAHGPPCLPRNCFSSSRPLRLIMQPFPWPSSLHEADRVDRVVPRNRPQVSLLPCAAVTGPSRTASARNAKLYCGPAGALACKPQATPRETAAPTAFRHKKLVRSPLTRCYLLLILQNV